VTRKELVIAAAIRSGYSTSRAGAIMALFFKAAEGFLARNETVQLRNFGTFKTTPLRLGRKDKPGKPIKVPSHTRRVSFTVGKGLADRIERT
jgi:nucleoid DNA-binding protein